ncbi:hypothetical protein ANCDUO_19667 [Ancylostoma duodenale]|uniref:Uncharacterized protein n=1 Tax=Ancylostoma duodenale TaxID=51022 RepID=A0A0C2FNS9_9BILA|nr:hypothetical protein ANCDUO_19667 [Ancylostoma duodenale]
MGKVASDLGSSEKTVRKVVKEDLNLRPFKIQKVHYLNERMKLKRLQKFRKMRCLAAAGRHRRTPFTDEKIFNVPDPWGKDFWPSNAPDLNPADFPIWSIWEAKLSSSRCYSSGRLKSALKQAWDEITEEQVAGIANNFLRRSKACEEAKEGHSQYVM